MFILNIVNTLVYDLEHKILIIVNNGMKSIPKMRMDTHIHAHAHALSGSSITSNKISVKLFCDLKEGSR